MNEHFMHLAIKSAAEGVAQNHGGPFGACIVRESEILATTHNTVLLENDPTCHAEMNAIRMACKKLGHFNLSSCTLFTTAEPCPMCLAGIYWARISTIYVGVKKNVAAAFGFDDAEFYSQLSLPEEKRVIPCTMGLLEKECEALFVDWKKKGRSLY
jgi:guanine deaminase